MRKFASILLVVILLYIIGGYRIVLPLLQERADRKLASLLDNNDYDESALIELRVELNAPYEQRYTEFERHYGQVEIDGKSYTYVKSKIEGNVVIFKCIPNESRQLLKRIEEEMTAANSAANMPGQSQHSTSFAKNVLGDFDDVNQFFQSSSLIILNRIFVHNNQLLIPQVAHNTPHQPPEC